MLIDHHEIRCSSDYKLAVGVVSAEARNDTLEVRKVGENPILQSLTRDYVNTGTAVLEKDILRYIKPTDTSLLGGAIPRAIEDGKMFGSFVWERWHHLLNENDYVLSHRSYTQRKSDEPGGSRT